MSFLVVLMQRKCDQRGTETARNFIWVFEIPFTQIHLD
jgi:hypothetical protein